MAGLTDTNQNNSKLNLINNTMKKTQTHISLISHGDTVEHCGELKTVCSSDINSGFMGVTIFGDSYRMGTLPVIKVTELKF